MTIVNAEQIEVTVSEVFGPTIQGEGPSAGRRCSFVRFGLCNLNCTWCDTPYTWDRTRYDLANELQRRTVADVLLELDSHDTRMLVVTGGEPMMQQKAIKALTRDGWWDRVEIETNGTRSITPWLRSVPGVFFNVSPKLASSGCDPVKRALHDDYVTDDRAIFKFVITVENLDADLTEVHQLVVARAIDPTRVWLMPEATDQLKLMARLPAVTEAAIVLGFNVSSRLHVAAWGNRRGV